ncbi:MAG: DUF2155 domain-containing protein [Roseivivax sp.]|nr:DUF2155 domain-containing protein [Roseivivax sp.]
MIRAVALALLLAPVPLLAQETVTPGTGAIIRALDKLTGEVVDLRIANGASAVFGRITVSLRECRYPEGNPSGDAYAFVTVQEKDKDAPAFAGWMVGSSPALNAMDHPRYDVWALRCTIS